MSRLWRVHLPGASAAGSEPLALEAAEAHHVRRVLRLAPGDPLTVFDGCGREWHATLVERGGAFAAELGEERLDPVEPSLELCLFQGLGKPERMDWVVQKATEIGVAALLLTTAGTRMPPPSADRLRRWRRIALEAAKQSGRRLVPRVDVVGELPVAATADTLALLCDPGAGALPIGRALPARIPARVWLAVGPEGGFGATAVAAAIPGGWLPVGLGPRVLRAETAGVIAAAILLHRLGDLGPAEPL